MFFNRLFIDGTWRDGSSRETFPVLNPADGSHLTDFPAATREDCLAAIESADRAAASWAATSARERSEILRGAFEVLSNERDTLAEIITLENGKAHRDALAEANYAIEFFRWFAEEAVRIPGEFRISPSGDKRIVVTHQPIGVSLLVTPWNFPAAMATRKLGPALAAGCTTILKPARETPLTAAFVVEALSRAGVPDGVVNLVTPVPTGPLVAEMIHHPSVVKLSFTGSTEVGRVLLREASETIVSCSMELGGNAPFIVLPGADLDQAVAGALVAKMRNGGAACTAANRFYVHHSLHDEFEQRLANELSELRVGAGTNRAHDLGALVSPYERDKVAGLVERAQREGAHLTLGGEAISPGAFYPPTVLVDVEHGSEINTTEIFGPVCALTAYQSADDAISMANDTEYGLIAYVFGPEQDAFRVALQLDAGMVAVNQGVLSDPAAPFGGMKQSGLGREGSTEGILEFLEEKYVGMPWQG